MCGYVECTSAHLKPAHLHIHHLPLIFAPMIFLTFFIGIIANFIGYIPPGNINLTLIQITMNRGMKEAVRFITAFSCVEFFFTYFIMHAARWLSGELKLSVIIDWIMVILFGVLGTITWVNRNKPPETHYS